MRLRSRLIIQIVSVQGDINGHEKMFAKGRGGVQHKEREKEKENEKERERETELQRTKGRSRGTGCDQPSFFFFSFFLYYKCEKIIHLVCKRNGCSLIASTWSVSASGKRSPRYISRSPRYLSRLSLVENSGVRGLNRRGMIFLPATEDERETTTETTTTTTRRVGKQMRGNKPSDRARVKSMHSRSSLSPLQPYSWSLRARSERRERE